MYRQQHVWTHPTVLGESCKGPCNSIVNFVVPSVRSWPVTLKSIISCLVGSAIHSHRMVCHIMLRPLGEKNYWNLFLFVCWCFIKWIRFGSQIPLYNITLKVFPPLLYSCILNQKIMGAICLPRQTHYHPTSEKNVYILRKISLPRRTHYQKLLVPFQLLQHLFTFLESILYQNPALWLVSSQEVCIISMLQMMVNFQTCINCLLINKENHWY